MRQGARRQRVMEEPPSTELPGMRNAIHSSTRQGLAHESHVVTEQIYNDSLQDDPVRQAPSCSASHEGDVQLDSEYVSRTISPETAASHRSPAEHTDKVSLPQAVARILREQALRHSHQPPADDREDSVRSATPPPPPSGHEVRRDLSRNSSFVVSPPRERPHAKKPAVRKAPSSTPPPLLLSSEINSTGLRSPTILPAPFNSPVSTFAHSPGSSRPLMHVELPRALSSRTTSERMESLRMEQQQLHTERRKDIRTPLIRNRLMEGESVRFYGVGLRSPARPCFSSSVAESMSPPVLLANSSTRRQEAPIAVPREMSLVDQITTGRSAPGGAPVLCSVWTTTKANTFINNF